ncbi:signal peptide peptidase SppA [Eubacterium sp. AB3007]|uniref:signal peptide peptidase SppA n=1 Tax=Eubacterium sp. AB3007 TaxID=1392487 RepID=UPI00068C5851|nr:signal peptide peptidase SppA [Eubacterium sp. AB3007]
MEDRVNVIEVNSPQTDGPKKKGWKKGLLIFVIILVAIIAIGSISIALLGDSEEKGSLLIGDNGHISMHAPYVGELYVEGTIGGAAGGLLGGSNYDYQHLWTLDRIDEMMDDKYNKGILLYVDTPGGAVFETDELYLKLKEYREKTGRPVYTYMASEAASGGYYISAATDKIYANRNCWTGSIGVIMGPMYDVKDLLDKYGVKTVTIASGENKAMGSSTAHMTKEQKEILQAMIDEAYDQFVGCVAEGRGMEEKKVRELADGRIYTARQAKANGLVDEIGSREDTWAAMKTKGGLGNAKLTPILYDPELSWADKLVGAATSLGQSRADSDLAAIKSLMEQNQKVPIYYMAPSQK